MGGTGLEKWSAKYSTNPAPLLAFQRVISEIFRSVMHNSLD
jgi:hypothetical protein